jgi:hypothetical protein
MVGVAFGIVCEYRKEDVINMVRNWLASEHSVASISTFRWDGGQAWAGLAIDMDVYDYDAVKNLVIDRLRRAGY